MKCLWLTLADPKPPDNGQFLYSNGLIHGVALAGVEVHVVGLARPGAVHRDGERAGTLTWHLAPHEPRSNWASLLTRYPNIASRTMTPALESLIKPQLDRNDWDLIVIDSLPLAWALERALRGQHRRPRCRIVHIAHNHEASVARKVAADEQHPLKRIFKRLDAVKIAWLERHVVHHADLVTSNTPEDCAKFLAEAPAKPVVFLPPGYGGRYVAARTIAADVPRRAVIVGSFDWSAKRTSLESFLELADPAFAQAGIELCVVGNAEESFLERLRQKFTAATRFTGQVDDVTPYLAGARVAIVPDRMGGFKLKGLDYVFNRAPIVGIDGAVPGMPLRPGESILLCPDHTNLVRAVLDVIDDLDRLNVIQARAFDACRDRFDWTHLCERLLTAVTSLEPAGLHAA